VASGGFSYGAPAGAATEVATVRAIYDAFARRDVDAALSLVADDFELSAAGTARASGRSEPYRGADGVREYLADAERVWEEFSVQAEDIRAVAGSVVVFGRVLGVLAGTSEVVARRMLWTWKLRDGKAVSVGVNDVGG
jgi:ketosteroid isomerase-like protein